MAQALHDYVRQRAQALGRTPGNPDEPARLVVLEQLICPTEAEIRRLDPCEARLLRLRTETHTP